MNMAQQTPALKVRVGGYSDKGRKTDNQDAFAAHLPSGEALRLKGACAAIADGVSSCADSHLASQTSVTSFVQDYFSTPDSWSAGNAASRVLHSLNSWLYQHNHQSKSERDSRLCTFSAVVIKSSTLHCFHVGDSRIYHRHQGQLELLTRDHTRMEKGRNYLARALGADPHLQVDYLSRPLAVGDQLLLTTDGIHEFLSQTQLDSYLNKAEQNLEECARTLVAAALAAGSHDNLTALVLTIDELPERSIDEQQHQILQRPIPPVLEAGNRIDQYEVLDVIFSNSRSHLYRVKDSSSGELYALKAPSLNYCDDADYLERFNREAWVGQQVQHPHVMRTRLAPEYARCLYYLSEHIEGQTLRQWMLDHPSPSLAQIRPLIDQLIQGLRAIQRADMLHQDLKPENLMITSDNQLKIIDFGTVRIAGIDELCHPLDDELPPGSVNYVAPEYRVGERADNRADLFSVAVICYEMLSGELPYKSGSAHKSELKHYSDLEYIPLRKRRPDLPLWLEACLKKALQPDPRHRYTVLSEFWHDLNHPNPRLEARLEQQPLLQKDPIRFWQLLAVLLLLLNLLQLLL
mgnify:CR=1 FL=1